MGEVPLYTCTTNTAPVYSPPPRLCLRSTSREIVRTLHVVLYGVRLC